MLGVIGTFSEESGAHVYLHGSSVARLMRITADQEVPLCVCGTLLDGYVLSLTPFHNSCNYRSAVVFGYATVVGDEAEKMSALEAITDNMVPGRWDESRVPPTKAEMTSTSVLRVRIHSASAKVRTGGPGEDRKDLKDDALRAKVWTGVVPLWQQWGEPVPAGENKVAGLPGYLSEWVSEENSNGKEKAVAAASL